MAYNFGGEPSRIAFAKILKIGKRGAIGYWIKT